jgi:hypothetical protein
MKRLRFPLLLIMLLAAACQPAAVPPTAAPPTTVPPTAAPATATAAPTSVAPTAAPATATTAATATVGATATPAATATSAPVHADLTPAQLAAEKALADSAKITVDQITLVSTEAVNWPDGCLGMVLPGVLCAKGPVPGFRIKLSAGGRDYEYHTNQDGTSVISTRQGFQSLRVAVRQADNSVQVVDTGFAAGGVKLDQGLLPLGGAVGATAYVLDFKGQLKVEMVDATGTHVLAFVDQPNYGLAVWPGDGSDKPRLAWATSPTGDAALTQLFIATADGSSVTSVLTETVASGQPPYQLVAERWSADGQALYFSREPYGIGGYIPFAGASSLYRYNLADKSVTELIPFNPSGGPGKPMICLDDLSADFSVAVGHCVDNKTITVHSLTGGGADQTITAPGTVTDFSVAGSARFSPDGKQVAFGLAKGDPSAEQGWLALSDSLSGSSKLITTTEAGHYYSVVAWLNDNTMLLQLNTLACNPDCLNSLWTIGSDGANLTKVADGTFLTLVGGN